MTMFTFAVAPHDVANFVINRLLGLSLALLQSEVWMREVRLILNVFS